MSLFSCYFLKIVYKYGVIFFKKIRVILNFFIPYIITHDTMDKEILNNFTYELPNFLELKSIETSSIFFFSSIVSNNNSVLKAIPSLLMNYFCFKQNETT